ncbi:MAG: hypothetical protein NTY86_18835 [Deltaproteobacteria bacterium]|nr:hypothetical protein [Deltaproteobacteria bacterium]
MNPVMPGAEELAADDAETEPLLVGGIDRNRAVFIKEFGGFRYIKSAARFIGDETYFQDKTVLG